MYRPLPDCLTIKESKIHGLGLFATEDIPEGTELGLSHIIGLFSHPQRTAIGDWYNHSNNPNCVKVKFDNRYTGSEENDRKHGPFTFYILKTIKDIKAGEEITVKYTLYNPEE